MSKQTIYICWPSHHFHSPLSRSPYVNAHVCVRACVSLRRIAEFSYIFLLYVFPFINMDTFEKEPSALSIYRTYSICVQLRKCGANKSDFSLSTPEQKKKNTTCMRASICEHSIVSACACVCMREFVCKQTELVGCRSTQGKKVSHAET